MDLVFPHHECEIAQAVASQGSEMVHYWMHNNMITINGQKMGKSLGNFITLEQFFTGSHEALDKAYSPMTIRFFILSAHYRGTVDFSIATFAANFRQKCYDAMNDDLQTPVVISLLFEACHIINTLIDHKAKISQEDLNEIDSTMQLFACELLGLKNETNNSGAREEAYGKVVDMVLELRAKARANKDWASCDQIRDMLKEAGFEVKDTKDGCVWKLNK